MERRCTGERLYPAQQVAGCHPRRAIDGTGCAGSNDFRCVRDVGLFHWFGRHALIVRQSCLNAKCAAIRDESQSLESLVVNTPMRTLSNKSADANEELPARSRYGALMLAWGSFALATAESVCAAAVGLSGVRVAVGLSSLIAATADGRLPAFGVCAVYNGRPLKPPSRDCRGRSCEAPSAGPLARDPPREEKCNCQKTGLWTPAKIRTGLECSTYSACDGEFPPGQPIPIRT